eukprot:TRINITY_DN2145_c0_g2_i1.p1 TRINITY_DN2145_c0_g2~~TRINITY_DN2145_c0_g2_i1.p1  ORF type:complete len:1799 (+),score=463.64 TRINITY_DN2145_c0_g2_i1:766-5397(+)
MAFFEEDLDSDPEQAETPIETMLPGQDAYQVGRSPDNVMLLERVRRKRELVHVLKKRRKAAVDRWEARHKLRARQVKRWEDRLENARGHAESGAILWMLEMHREQCKGRLEQCDQDFAELQERWRQEDEDLKISAAERSALRGVHAWKVLRQRQAKLQQCRGSPRDQPTEIGENEEMVLESMVGKLELKRAHDLRHATVRTERAEAAKKLASRLHQLDDELYAARAAGRPEEELAQLRKNRTVAKIRLEEEEEMIRLSEEEAREDFSADEMRVIRGAATEIEHRVHKAAAVLFAKRRERVLQLLRRLSELLRTAGPAAAIAAAVCCAATQAALAKVTTGRVYYATFRSPGLGALSRPSWRPRSPSPLHQSAAHLTLSPPTPGGLQRGVSGKKTSQRALLPPARSVRKLVRGEGDIIRLVGLKESTVDHALKELELALSIPSAYGRLVAVDEAEKLMLLWTQKRLSAAARHDLFAPARVAAIWATPVTAVENAVQCPLLNLISAPRKCREIATGQQPSPRSAAAAKQKRDSKGAASPKSKAAARQGSQSPNASPTPEPNRIGSMSRLKSAGSMSRLKPAGTMSRLKQVGSMRLPPSKGSRSGSSGELEESILDGEGEQTGGLHTVKSIGGSALGRMMGMRRKPDQGARGSDASQARREVTGGSKGENAKTDADGNMLFDTRAEHLWLSPASVSIQQVLCLPQGPFRELCMALIRQRVLEVPLGDPAAPTKETLQRLRDKQCRYRELQAAAEQRQTKLLTMLAEAERDVAVSRAALGEADAGSLEQRRSVRRLLRAAEAEAARTLRVHALTPEECRALRGAAAQRTAAQSPRSAASPAVLSSPRSGQRGQSIRSPSCSTGSQRRGPLPPWGSRVEQVRAAARDRAQWLRELRTRRAHNELLERRHRDCFARLMSSGAAERLVAMPDAAFNSSVRQLRTALYHRAPPPPQRAGPGALARLERLLLLPSAVGGRCVLSVLARLVEPDRAVLREPASGSPFSRQVTDMTLRQTTEDFADAATVPRGRTVYDVGVNMTPQATSVFSPTPQLPNFLASPSLPSLPAPRDSPTLPSPLMGYRGRPRRRPKRPQGIEQLLHGVAALAVQRVWRGHLGRRVVRAKLALPLRRLLTVRAALDRRLALAEAAAAYEPLCAPECLDPLSPEGPGRETPPPLARSPRRLTRSEQQLARQLVAEVLWPQRVRRAAQAAAAAAAAAAEALSEAGEGTRSPIVASLEPAAGAPGPEPQQQQGACSPAEGELSTTQRQPAPAPAALRRPSPDPSTSPHSAELNASNASHRRTLLGKTQSPGSHQQQQQEADGGSSAPDAVEPPSSECGPMWQPVSGLASESQSEAHACALAAESAGGGRSHPSDSGAVPLSVAALRELQGQLQALSPRPPAGRIARWLGELSAPHSGPADGPAALGESWAGISELRGGTPLHSQLSGSEDGEEDSTSDGSGTRSGTGRVGTEGADCSQRIITMIDLSHDAVEQCRPPGVLESRSERQSSGARRSRRSRDTPASSSRLSWQQPKAGSPLAAMVATARLVEGW